MSDEFFESLYVRAGRDERSVPWQDAVSRPMIAEWISSATPAEGDRALVVAAGLGDDAAALARRGFAVVAFDQAPTAVDWARSRHAEADVDWQVADLFDPPVGWRGGFDPVVEVFTIQSIEPSAQPAAVDAVRALVRPGGTLVAVALVHDGTLEPSGPPWPLDPTTVASLTDGWVERDRRRRPVGEGLECILVELEWAER